MRKETFVVTACALALLCLAAPAVMADDMPPPNSRSASSAVLGAEGLYAGALPPPGFHLLNYSFYYRAHELKGKGGGHVSSPPFTDFKARAFANIIRPIYVSDKKILGANPAWHVVVPLVAKTLTSDFFEDSEEGLGDIYISPLILGWHRPPWHWVAGLDLITPTGDYQKHGVTTIGNNHWTFEGAVAVSYMPESGFSASTKLMYDIHTEDRSAKYKEGDQFHLDYDVGYSFGANRQWRAAACGYFLTSLEDDHFNHDRIDGSKERVFAVGPGFFYSKGKLTVGVKVQKEMRARNRPQGTASWIKIIYSY